MKVIDSIQKYSKKPLIQGAALVIVVFIIAVSVKYVKSHQDEVDTASVNPTVVVASASTLTGGQSISLIGTVRAFTEAQITTERAGRVTSVSAKLGGTVAAGQVIATLENASEQAAVLQAQGAYEAALAASTQTGISVQEAETTLNTAKNNAVTNFRSSYNTVSGIVRNDIDDFFANGDSQVPGLRLDGKGQTTSLNAARVQLQSTLTEWQTKSSAISKNSDLRSELAYAQAKTEDVIKIVDSFLYIFPLQDTPGKYTDAELQTFATNMTSIRSNLLSLQNSLNANIAAINSAEDAVKRATVNAAGGTSSGADAQVKQALGSLRAAQANLAKTVLRTPIGGTVNSLDIKLGDFISSFETVSVIANNNALEIVTYVGDFERDQMTPGDKVFIEGKYEGVVTQIAPAVDAQTRKTEVRIATDNTDISNGDTVRITKEANTDTDANTDVYIPITAVKFEAEDGYVFTIVDGALNAVPVTIGKIRGSSVEILEGLSQTDEFVVDARGLTTGSKVDIKI